MQIQDFTQYTDSCFNGEAASCSCACPFGLDLRSFTVKCEKGRWAAAWKTYRDAVFFPSLVSALCPAPCVKHCQREGLGGAIDIPALERACIAYSKNKKAEIYGIPPKSQRIAVVGAGVAGLSAALNLAQKRFSVTVFDRQPGWGGRLRSHPLFEAFEADFSLQFSVVDAEFYYEREISSPDELSGFDAVYMSTGVGGTDFSGEKFFRGGELAGMSLMEGIAVGAEVSKVIETYLATGRAGKVDNVSYDFCTRTVSHEGEASVPAVEVTDEDSAKAEAARCMHCDCTECMRDCEVLSFFRKKPRSLSREAFSDSQANPPIATQSLVRETYSCTNCGSCTAVCPGHANIGAMFMLSRSNRFERGTAPAAFHDYWLREMDFSSGEASAYLTAPGREKCSYAFFPGCRLGMDNTEHVKRAYAFLLDYTDGDTGLMLGCCGAPALWAGDTARLNANADTIRSAWESMGRPTLVFACATCDSMFETYLPEIKRISLYELMQRASLPVSFPDAAFAEAAVFDPCSARNNSEMARSVRALAENAGAKLEELDGAFKCCGYGGHIQVPNPEIYLKISESRANESDKPYIVYCANCREVFLSRGKQCSHILDLYFGSAPVPALSGKRQNALHLKSELLKEIWNMDFTPSSAPWDGVELIIPDEIQAKMDACLITADDVRETVWYAEQSGDKLTAEGGVNLASLVKTAVTYWVQYRAAEGAWSLSAVYSHRMKWRGVNGN